MTRLEEFKSINKVIPYKTKIELVYKEIENGNFTKGFLKDLSVSRNNFSWGIKIPCDCENKELLQDFNTWKNDIKDTYDYLNNIIIPDIENNLKDLLKEMESLDID